MTAQRKATKEEILLAALRLSDMTVSRLMSLTGLSEAEIVKLLDELEARGVIQSYLYKGVVSVHRYFRAKKPGEMEPFEGETITPELLAAWRALREASASESDGGDILAYDEEGKPFRVRAAKL